MSCSPKLAQQITSRLESGLLLADPDRDADLYRLVWEMLRKTPQVYGQNAGFDSFDAFMAYGRQSKTKDFFLLQDGEPLAMASLQVVDSLVCRFALIAPPRPRLRRIIPLLRELEAGFFETLHYLSYYVVLPDTPAYARARKFAQRFGLTEEHSTIFAKKVNQYVAGK